MITLCEVLAPAEQALASGPSGAAQVQEYRRQLFATSADSLRQAIQRINGVEVHEPAVEVNTATEGVVHAFTTGTMLQVFLPGRHLSAESWNANLS